MRDYWYYKHQFNLRVYTAGIATASLLLAALALNAGKYDHLLFWSLLTTLGIASNVHVRKRVESYRN